MAGSAGDNTIGRAAGIAMLAAVLAGCGDRPAADAGAGASADAKQRAAREAQRAEAEAEQAVVRAFRVASTRYRLEPQESGWARPYLDLVMENGTPLDIRAFTLQATLVSPGREAPWMTQELKVPAKRGVAPSASFSITLTPTPDSPWALANATHDATMKVEVLTVTDVNGKVFRGAGAFRPEDALPGEARP